MFRSLNVKLVLTFIVIIVSVMSVVGVFLLNNVNTFYADDFLKQMNEGFSDRVVSRLADCFGQEDSASAQRDILIAYSGNFSFDNYRNFYILDMDGNILESSAADTVKLPKTHNLLCAMNRKNGENNVSGTGFFDYAYYISSKNGEGIVYIYDDLTRMKSLMWVLFAIILQALFIGLAIALFVLFLNARHHLADSEADGGRQDHRLGRIRLPHRQPVARRDRRAYAKLQQNGGQDREHRRAGLGRARKADADFRAA